MIIGAAHDKDHDKRKVDEVGNYGHHDKRKEGSGGNNLCQNKIR